MLRIINVRLAIVALLMSCSALSFSAEKPLNVVVFLVDDLRPDLGCYGNELIKSPNIDKLASEGVMFNKAYCQEAICAPSRMSILTGLRPETFAIYDIFTKFKQTHPNALTLPALFKDNGYKTVSIGKVYHHGVDDQESWSTYYGKEVNSYVIPGNAELKPAFEAGDVGDEAYKDGRAAKNAIATLNQLKDDKFIMFVGLSKPHLPFNAPKKYWDLYDRDDFKIPVKQAPKDAYSMALTTWGELRGYGNIPQEGVLNDDLTKELINGYYACVSYIDAQVGKVMTTLEDLGLRENTMVVFMSDHGWKLGEYGAWCKHSNFDLDVRVPLIISRETGHSNRQSNVISEAVVENVDVFPTLSEACGISIPSRDGKSLLSLTDNPTMDWSKVAYGLYPRGTFAMGCTCTDGEYRYTEWRDYITQAIKGVELYPCDENFAVRSANLAMESQYDATEAKFKALLLEHFPANHRAFSVANMPDEHILEASELLFLKPISAQTFEFGVPVKVQALAGDSIDKLQLVVGDDTLRSISVAPFVWGTDSLVDPELFRLEAGGQTLKLLGFNGGVLISQKDVAITVKKQPIPVEQIPYLGVAISIPGRIEAENYDVAGEKWSYHDTDTSNASTLYRNDGVDIVAEGTGFCVDNDNNDEWQEYTLEVQDDGIYDVVLSYSSDRSSGNSRITVALPDEGVMIVEDYKLPSTYSWSRFFEEVIATDVSLTKGLHVLRTTAVLQGYYLDWIEIKMKGSAGVDNIHSSEINIYPNPNSSGMFNLSEISTYEVFSIAGVLVVSGQGESVDLSAYPKGVYILQTEQSIHKIVFE